MRLFAVLILCVSITALITFPNKVDAASGLTSADVARLQSVQDAEISPDGNWIALRLAVPRLPTQGEDGSSWTELHVIDVQTGRQKPFVTGEVSIGPVQWAHDSKTLYYTAKRFGDKNTCLYQIPVDGGESVPVLRQSESIRGFQFSLDGGKLALLALTEKNEVSKKQDEQGFNQEIYEEDARSAAVWIGDFDNGLVKNITQIELTGSAYEVHWSPQGDRLAVVAAPTPSVDDQYMKRQVHVIDVASQKHLSSLNTSGKLGEVCWNSTGEKIAVISGQDKHDPSEGRIVIHDLANKMQTTTLLADYEAHVIKINWLDSDTLLWLAEENIGSQVGTITVDGKVDRWLDPAEIVFSSFSIDDSTNGLALVGSSYEHPSEVFFLQRHEQKIQRLTNHNEWLKDRDFGRQVAVKWNARDGLPLEGILIYPLDYDEAKKYPTIMYVHGGPESHEKNAWLTSYSRPGQVAAAKGFVVFYPNYRGSTGRGVQFSMAGQGDAAGKEFDDLIDGIDYLIAKGIADSTAIGVTGGSYGGYASAWCSTYYSDRFAASVMFVGISDNLSKVGTTDIPEEMYLVHHRKRLWDDWNYFLERSPIRYVERNQTPTLILHGKEDPRVHPSQSLELHRHLKTLDQAPVRLVLYPGEGHGNKRAASKFDYNLRMLRWMEHFLIARKQEAPSYSIDYDEHFSGDHSSED
ncbi:S9 family peptidase [Rubripirellula sp.]|nr:S9 family peptidase [Rubripirellula sp.]